MLPQCFSPMARWAYGFSLLALVTACDAREAPQNDGAIDVDPCELVTCGALAACEVQQGAARCVCVAGATDDGGVCVADDTCTHVSCGDHARCEDVGGAPRCICDPGYVVSAGTCMLDPACADLACDVNATCVIQGTTRACACNPGFVGDGQTCADEDGCANEACFPGVQCEDVAVPGSGRRCGTCPPGYSGDGVTCSELDACERSPCFEGVACTDLPPPSEGRNCGPCPEGMVGDGVICARPLELRRFASTQTAACALREDDTARCVAIPRAPEPRGGAPEGEYFASIAAGHHAFCTVRYYNGGVACWSPDGSSYPLPDAFTSTSFQQVAVGYEAACAVVAGDDTIACWTLAGEVVEAPSGAGYVQVVMDSTPDRPRSICGLRNDGSVECLGLEGPESSDFTKLTVNAGRFCGEHSDGSYSCWGTSAVQVLDASADYLEVSGPYGLSLQGTLEHYPGVRLAGAVFTQIAADAPGSFVCGLGVDGRVDCDGLNMPYLDHVFLQLAASSGGEPRVCGITSALTLACWGEPAPAAPPAPPGDMQFAHLTESCGLRKDGRFVCWDEDGVHVGNRGPFIQALGSYWGSVLLRYDGSVEWNYTFDALANGEPPPEAAGPYMQISGSPHEVCGLRRDGSVTCFSFIPRGVCMTDPIDPPDCWTVISTVVPREERFTRIDSFLDFFCGLHEDGTMLCIDNPEGRGVQTSELLDGVWHSAAFSDNLSCPLNASGQTGCAGFWGIVPDGVHYRELDNAGFDEICGLTNEGRVHCWDFRVPTFAPLTSFDLLMD